MYASHIIYIYVHIIVNDTLKHCINEMLKSVIQLKVISVCIWKLLSGFHI